MCGGQNIVSQIENRIIIPWTRDGEITPLEIYGGKKTVLEKLIGANDFVATGEVPGNIVSVRKSGHWFWLNNYFQFGHNLVVGS
jgi:hypothetical protein